MLENLPLGFQQNELITLFISRELNMLDPIYMHIITFQLFHILVLVTGLWF